MGKESEETFFQRRYTSGQQALKRFSILLIIQFSCSVVSDSLRPHELQHARPPCPSPTPGVHPNPCPLSWWRHPTISSSVVPFCPQSLIIRETQMKTTMRYYLTPIRMPITKKTHTQKITSVSDTMEKLESSRTNGGNIKWYCCCGKTL